MNCLKIHFPTKFCSTPQLSPISPEEFDLYAFFSHIQFEEHVKDSRAQAGFAAGMVARPTQSFSYFSGEVGPDSSLGPGPVVRHILACKRVKDAESRIARSS